MALGVTNYLFGQESNKDFRKIVLNKAIKDSLFVFNQPLGETQLVYLGILNSIKGRYYKIISYSWLDRQSHKAINRILIYDKYDRYLGNYKIDMKDELPTKIQNNELVFDVRENDQSNLIETRISFAKMLPRKIVITNGNLYLFQGD